MKIVPLFFACVALLNFAKIGARCDGGAGRGSGNPPERRRTILPNPNPGGARNNGGPAGRGRGGTARRNRQTEVGARNRGGPAGRDRGGIRLLDTIPVVRVWSDHPHNHPIEIRNTVVNRPGIYIKKVVGGLLAFWHLLEGDLVPDSNITSCNGPHGYAIVDLVDSDRLYACIRANMFHRESIDREYNVEIPVFVATVFRTGRPELEADLAPRDVRSRLNSERLLYHGENAIRMLGTQSVGNVRYVKSDRVHPIDVDGDLYHFPEPGPRP